MSDAKKKGNNFMLPLSNNENKEINGYFVTPY